jgi:hypothetical protein
MTIYDRPRNIALQPNAPLGTMMDQLHRSRLHGGPPYSCRFFFFKLSLSYKALLCLVPPVHKYRSHRPFPFSSSLFNFQRTGSSKSLSFFLSLILYFYFRFTTSRLVPFSPPSIFEMFSKSFIAFVFLLTLTSSVNVQAAAISPALSIRGNLMRNDLQRPSNGNHCGDVNVVADTNGTSSALVTNLNR